MALSLDELFNSSRYQWAVQGLQYVLNFVSGSIMRRSGKLLRETWRRSTLRKDGSGFTIRHGTFYGHIWDVAGRKAYTVQPKARKRGMRSALRMNIGGSFHFARKANIPSARPTLFMKNAIAASDPGVRALAEKHMTGALNSTLLNRVIRVGLR
jgi:hypothetical protein